MKLWKRHWANENEKRKSLSHTISVISEKKKKKKKSGNNRVFEIFLVIPATSACVERSNSVLRYIKNIHRNSISEPRLNAQILMYVHRYIKLDSDKITDFFASKYPRIMLLILPEKTEKTVHQQLSSCSLKRLVKKKSPD